MLPTIIIIFFGCFILERVVPGWPETEFFWSESISDGGTLQPIIVSGYSLDLVKTRVCQLSNFVPVVGDGGWLEE